MGEKIVILTNSIKSKKLCEQYRNMGKNAIEFGDVYDLNAVKKINPDFTVSYGYAQKVPKETVDYLGKNIINTHPALLPLNRGSFANFWSFIYNTRKGVTIHYLDEGLDTGDIILQEEMFFEAKNETFQTTYNALEAKSVELLTKNIDDLIHHRIISKKQSGRATYHSIAKFKKFKEKIPFSWDENIGEFLKKNEERILLFLKEEKNNLSESQKV